MYGMCGFVCMYGMCGFVCIRMGNKAISAISVFIILKKKKEGSFEV